MSRPILPDELWEMLKPVIPKRAYRAKAGRPPVTNREALTGILFVLKTGIAWEHLPKEIQCGSGMTCLRRLREWQADGTWEEIRRIVITCSRVGRYIDWARAERQIRTTVGAGEKVDPVALSNGVFPRPMARRSGKSSIIQ